MDEELIAIPKSEYDDLLECKRELISLREQLIADRLSEIQIQMRQFDTMIMQATPPGSKHI